MLLETCYVCMIKTCYVCMLETCYVCMLETCYVCMHVSKHVCMQTHCEHIRAERMYTFFFGLVQWPGEDRVMLKHSLCVSQSVMRFM